MSLAALLSLSLYATISETSFHAPLAVPAVPVFGNPINTGQKVSSMNNLKQLATALNEYAMAHQGAYPATLQEIDEDGTLAALMQCPLTKQAYIYKGKGLKQDALVSPASVPLLETVPLNDGSKLVAYADGHVAAVK